MFNNASRNRASGIALACLNQRLRMNVTKVGTFVRFSGLWKIYGDEFYGRNGLDRATFFLINNKVSV